jgi:LysM repeat protein
MKKRRKSPARLVAVIALIGAAVAIGAVVSGATDDSASKAEYGKKQDAPKKHRTKASSYVVENGDTLLAIAHKTGIPIRELEALNPEVDPQILIAGEKLKLQK